MTMADELEKLHRLVLAGALTQAEYEAAKASNDDKWIAGVCGGIAAITGVESWIWRLVFVLGLMVGGFTVVLYLIFWIFVPRDGM
jgi:phage shock protein C